VTPRATSPSRGRLLGIVFGVLSAVCFGVSGPLAKAAMSAGLSPLDVTAARISLTALVMFAVVGLLRPSALRVRPGRWRLLISYGLLGFAGVQACYFLAVSRIPVGVALLLEYLAPTLIVLWVRLVRRVRLPAGTWLGAGLAVLGLALIGEVWHGLRLDPLGVLAALAAAVCFSGYFLLSDYLPADRGEEPQNPLGLIGWGAVFGAVTLAVVNPPWRFPFDALTHSVPFGSAQVPTWTLLLVLGLVSSALAYLLGVAAVRALSAPAASVLGVLEPVVAAAVAWVLLDEALSVPQLAGAGLLLLGAVLAQLTTPPRGGTTEETPTVGVTPAPAGTDLPPDGPGGTPTTKAGGAGDQGRSTGNTVGTIIGRRR